MDSDQWSVETRAQGARRGAVLWLAALVPVLLGAGARPAQAGFAPDIAIVLCDDSYDEDWYSVHSSSQALVGLAGLAGVPYHTVTLAELVADPAAAHTSLWFSSCPFVSEADIGPLAALLEAHVSRGGSVFLDGPLGIAYRDAAGMEAYRDMEEFFPFLGVDDGGWFPIADHAIKTSASAHSIAVAAGYPAGTQLTQGILYGMETMEPADRFDPATEVLLELVSPDGMTTYPYLVASEPVPGAKVVAVGGYGDYVGPATPFRNDAPAGFYENRLLPYLVHAVLWLIGPDGEPFVGLQLSHAPMTVIGRLDGDWSGEHEATEETFGYLIDMARQTGVATVYGIVSSFAEATGWGEMRSGGGYLQALGGSIGTHSRTHNDEMSENLDEASFTDEVAGSLQDIRAALTDATFTPDCYAFINPGNTIESRHYGRFFGDVELFMTHGFETSVPYSSGVMGFGLPPGMAPRPVINNTPVPDFQWLYAVPEWSYTVAQAAEYQAKILDYYQTIVGRGVLYNQMWHDYSISDLDAPPGDPGAATVRPLFDVNLEHFATERIYAPSVRELVAKMHIAHQVGLSTVMDGDTLIATLDYSAVPAEYRPYAAGMGVRLHRSDQAIAGVHIDDQPHAAFTESTVILPAPAADRHTVAIRLGAWPEAETRLTYLSKPLDRVTMGDGGLEVTLLEPGMATRMCVAAPVMTVLLGVDVYKRTTSGELCGRLLYGSPTRTFATRAVDTGEHQVYVVAAGRALTAAAWADRTLTLDVAPGQSGTVEIATAVAPERVLIDSAQAGVEFVDGRLLVQVPDSTGPVTVAVHMPVCVDDDRDGITTCAGDCNDQEPTIGADCMPPPVPENTGCGGCAAGSQAPGGGFWALLLAVWAVLLRRRGPRGRVWRRVSGWAPKVGLLLVFAACAPGGRGPGGAMDAGGDTDGEPGEDPVDDIPVNDDRSEVPDWVIHARIGGTDIDREMDDSELMELLLLRKSENVSVLEFDSNLSEYMSDIEFTREARFIDYAAQMAHSLDMHAVIYYPALEVLTPNGANIDHTMYKDHPDWVQYGISGEANVFYGSLEHWVEPDEESAWMSPNSPYRDYFIERIRMLAATAVDGVWIDVPVFWETATEWPGAGTYSAEMFRAWSAARGDQGGAGFAVPSEEDFDDPGFRAWVRWRHENLAEFLEDVRLAAQEINPDFMIIIEAFPLEHAEVTSAGLDGNFRISGKNFIRVWEVDSVSNTQAMKWATMEDFHCKIAMNKYALAAERGNQAWVFSYGYEPPDAALSLAAAVSVGVAPFEAQTPEMTLTVDSGFRARWFEFIKTHSDALLGTARHADVGIWMSSASRDYMDRPEGGSSGMFVTEQPPIVDPEWWAELDDDTETLLTKPHVGGWRGAAYMLSQLGVGYTVVTDPGNPAQHVAPLKLLWLPSVTALSDASAKIIRDHVWDGGVVLATGRMPGVLDDLGGERSVSALDDVFGFDGSLVPRPRDQAFGQGRAIYRPDLRGVDAYAIAGDPDRAARTMAAIEPIVRAHVPDTVRFAARPGIHVEVARPTATRHYLYIVNFTGMQVPLVTNVVDLDLEYLTPEGFSVVQAEIFTPDTGGQTGLAEVTETGSGRYHMNVRIDQFALVALDLAAAP